MVILERRFILNHYFVISFVTMIIMLISPGIPVKIVQPLVAQSNSISTYNLMIMNKTYTFPNSLTSVKAPTEETSGAITKDTMSKARYYLCIFSSVAICPNEARPITTQIKNNTPPRPSLEELSGENVAQGPTNATSARAKMVPTITPQETNNITATVRTPAPPSLEELAGENATKVANATSPSTSSNEHNRPQSTP